MLGRQCPFSPSVPAEAGCLFTVAAGVRVFISGESLHCFLVGWCTNKSYVIATSDLWLFIHASNLLSLNSPPHSPTCKWPMCSREINSLFSFVRTGSDKKYSHSVSERFYTAARDVILDLRRGWIHPRCRHHGRASVAAFSWIPCNSESNNNKFVWASHWQWQCFVFWLY